MNCNYPKNKSMAPVIFERILPVDQIWVEKTKFKIEAYEKELAGKYKEFKKLSLWVFEDANGHRIKPDAAKSFMKKVEDNPEHEDRIKKMLTSVETTSKLFTQLKIDHQVRRAS